MNAYELANDSDDVDLDEMNDSADEWDAYNPARGDNPLTELECIGKARELLADCKDVMSLDPSVARDLEVAYALLCSVIELRHSKENAIG